MLYDLEAVKRIMPHRDPFLFLDSIEKVYFDDPEKEAMGSVFEIRDLAGATVEANYYLNEDHPIFAGHFPGNPILPGVVQIEMIAQAAIFACHKAKDDMINKKLEVALLGVSSSKFRKPLVPGMNLKIISKCMKYRGVMMQQDGEIYCDDQLVAQASILASLKAH